MAEPKSTAVRAERRRRTGETGAVRSKLHLPAEIDLDPAYTYRWVNDDVTGRLADLTTNDDWDIVTDTGAATQSKGTALSRKVGVKEDGTALLSYLCKKPREFAEADAMRAQAAIDERMGEIKQGHGAGAAGLNPADSTTYVPQSGIKFA